MKKETNVYLKALGLAVPMMVQNGLSNAVGLVDHIMVGSLGTESITAVSIAVQVVLVYSMAIFGGLSGPGIFGAQYYGKGDNEGVRRVFRLKLWIAFFVVLVGFVAFFLFGDKILLLYLQGESQEIDPGLTLSLAKDYLSIMIIGFVPFSISQVYASCLRETGDSFKPMIAGICSVVGDIVFNYLLIFGKFGFPQLGVQGAAIATTIGRIFELLVIVIWSHAKIRDHEFLRGVYKTLRVPISSAYTIVKKGIPIFINELLWSMGLAALTMCYSIRSLDVVAGLEISNTLCNLFSVTFASLGVAVGIICGQYLGANKKEEAMTMAIKLMWFAIFVSVGMGLVVIGLSGAFPQLFNTTELVRNYSKIFIRITALFIPVQGALNSLYFTLRSGGKTVITFIFDAVYNWVISIPLAYFLCVFTSLNIILVYALVLSMDILKTAFGYYLVKKGYWLTNIVDEMA